MAYKASGKHYRKGMSLMEIMRMYRDLVRNNGLDSTTRA